MRIDRLTDRVLAHKRRVIAIWLVLTLAGFVGSGQVAGALDDDAGIADSEAFATNQVLEDRFGGGEAPLAAVVTLPRGTAVESVRADLRALERALGDALPGARVASYASTGERGFLSDDGLTTFVLAFPAPSGAGADVETLDPAVLDAVERAVDGASVGGGEVLLTGEAVLAAATAGEGDSGILSETLLAGVAALAVLAFVFASALALVPLLMAVVAIPTTMLAVWALTAVADVSFVVQALVAFIGLGIAIDYALLIVMRWREERDAGVADEQAVRIAMSTAGRAVVFSGTTVAIGLLSAVVVDVPFLRSMGYGGLLIPLVSVAVALTLVPVVLATVGPRADRRRLRRTERAERHWAGLARRVVRVRWPAAIAGAAALVALCVVASGMVLGQPEFQSLGGSGDAAQAVDRLEASGIGTSPLAPIEVLTPAERAEDTARALAEVDGVRAASAPGGPAWRDGGQAVVEVFAADDSYSAAGRDTVAAVREAASALPGTTVSGSIAEIEDFVDAVYDGFPLMLGLIALITFVLLARAFRSIVLPLKAVVLNLLSVFATWGVMTLVWQDGVGTELLFGTEPIGAVVFWTPIIVFAFIYGLSMDYEVFILARMREEYDRTGSTDEAIVRGIARTGRLVTSAALIVFLSFAALGTAGDVDLQVLATGLAAGILLDAVLVRTVLVPATVSLFGRWNWWLPETARRLLRLQPEPG